LLSGPEASSGGLRVEIAELHIPHRSPVMIASNADMVILSQ
jgi:hypothetical protein